MRRTREFHPAQDPFWTSAGDDRLSVFMTRQAGTETWDVTVYVSRFKQVIQLWGRTGDGTLVPRFYGVLGPARMIRWTLVRIAKGTGSTDLIRAGLDALRASAATVERTERPDMDPLF